MTGDETTALSNRGTTLVCLPALPSDALDAVLRNLREALTADSLLVASPVSRPDGGEIHFVDTAATGAGASFIPTAADYLAAGSLARENQVARVLVLGSEAQSISAATLSAMAQEIYAGNDLALPRLPTGPHEGLVNSALLYPMSRALFAQAAHFPLPVDVAFSPRMASRLATVAQRFTSTNQPGAFLWPIAEAAAAGFLVREVDSPGRIIPQPPGDNIADLLAGITGSLFAEVETRAAFWQRARLFRRDVAAAIPPPAAPPLSLDLTTELTPHVENFRLAYNNLHELWSLVLPPNSLLALKKLSVLPLENFHMADDLWARTVYDFLLAWRLRTINRGHLLGAFTPLYFAWVASHLGRVQNDPAVAALQNEEAAAAFEAEKPYLVARWRWPDRFNA